MHGSEPPKQRRYVTNGPYPAPAKVPWNKRRIIGARPPLQTKHVWSIRTKLQMEGRKRDLAMFNLAIDSKLRGCDVVRVKVEDVAPRGLTADRACIRQRKTGHPVKFELTEQTREAVDAYLKTKPKHLGDYLFDSRGRPDLCISTRQYSRLVSSWIAGIGLDQRLFGTHSLRRTKATLIYRRTGNLRAVQLLLAIRRSRARSGISGSRSTTHSRLPNRSMSELPGQSGHALPTPQRQLCADTVL